MFGFARIRETDLLPACAISNSAFACAGAYKRVVNSPPLCWQGCAVAGMSCIVHDRSVNRESMLLLHLRLVLSQRTRRFLPFNEREGSNISIPGYRFCTNMGREWIMLPADDLMVINGGVAAIQVGKSLLARDLGKVCVVDLCGATHRGHSVLQRGSVLSVLWTRASCRIDCRV